MGGDAFQREVPDDDLFADQRPQGGVERKPSAAKERVRPVGQQGVVHRQPQREGEADALDGDLHAERPGRIGDGTATDQVLDGRNVEQRRDQQQDEENDEQRPERMFENLFQHLWKQRVPESGKRQAAGLRLRVYFCRKAVKSPQITKNRRFGNGTFPNKRAYSRHFPAFFPVCPAGDGGDDGNGGDAGDGSRSGCGVSGTGKKNVRPCKPDVSVHFADIQPLLAEREGYEPISPKILIIKVITISKNTLVTI